eukprot:1608340-Amphidinium_carterae.1
MPFRVPSADEVPMDLQVPKTRRRLPGIRPEPVAMLFPGIGSQKVGMLESLMSKPLVAQMLEEAQSILDWDLKGMLLSGTDDVLADPKHAIPAVYVANAVAMQELKEQQPTLWSRPQAVAGLSTGELSALQAAGVLSYKDGLHLAKHVGTAVQGVVSERSQAMCSIVGLDRSVIEQMCADAAAEESSPDAVCQISQSVFPNGFLCSGTAVAIGAVTQKAKDGNALQARVNSRMPALHCP